MMIMMLMLMLMMTARWQTRRALRQQEAAHPPTLRSLTPRLPRVPN
eukprot:COSAG01_NODE_17426_length_1152_cov_1.633428_1_plen_45_part_10